MRTRKFTSNTAVRFAHQRRISPGFARSRSIGDPPEAALAMPLELSPSAPIGGGAAGSVGGGSPGSPEAGFSSMTRQLADLWTRVERAGPLADVTVLVAAWERGAAGGEDHD